MDGGDLAGQGLGGGELNGRGHSRCLAAEHDDALACERGGVGGVVVELLALKGLRYPRYAADVAGSCRRPRR